MYNDSQKTAKAIEIWPIERLRLYANNPRTHSPDQVKRIANSIARFGFNNPVLVDTADGIIAGHGRLLAAKALGLAAVPVIVLDHLTDAERRAYVIADNQLALMAGWDEELLAAEIALLSDEGFPLDLIGFSDAELSALLDASLADLEQVDEDKAPALPEVPVTCPGDRWLCGQHVVMCGDATKEADLDALLSGVRPAMTFADAPYNVNYHDAAGATILNDNLGAGFAAFLAAAVGNVLRVTDGAIYVCMSSSELATLQRVFVAAGGHWSTFIIWAKNSFTLGRSDFQRQYEPILYGWPQGKSHYWCGARDQGDVWFIDKPICNDLHPTMKPVELVRRAILNSSLPKAIVLDPFGGSGTTMIACEQTGRAARLLELDPRYVDVAVQRWQTQTGLLAVHIPQGEVR